MSITYTPEFDRACPHCCDENPFLMRDYDTILSNRCPCYGESDKPRTHVISEICTSHFVPHSESCPRRLAIINVEEGCLHTQRLISNPSILYSVVPSNMTEADLTTLKTNDARTTQDPCNPEYNPENLHTVTTDPANIKPSKRSRVKNVIMKILFVLTILALIAAISLVIASVISNLGVAALIGSSCLSTALLIGSVWMGVKCFKKNKTTLDVHNP